MKSTYLKLAEIVLIIVLCFIGFPALTAETDDSDKLKSRISELLNKNTQKLKNAENTPSLEYKDENFIRVDWESLRGLTKEEFYIKQEKTCSYYEIEEQSFENEETVFEDLACLPTETVPDSIEEGESDNYEYSYDEESDVLEIKHKYNENAKLKREKVDEEVIKRKAEKDVRILLPENGANLELFISPVNMIEIRENSEPKKHLIAYNVTVQHKINKMRILDHRMVLTYFIDGSFQRGIMKWREISPQKHILRETKTDQEIIERIQQKIESHPLGDDDKNLEVEPALRIDTEGNLYQVLQVSGHLKADFGDSFNSVVEVRI